MTDAELADIKARWKHIALPRDHVIISAHALVDVPKLIGEVERLRHDIEHLQDFLYEGCEVQE